MWNPAGGEGTVGKSLFSQDSSSSSDGETDGSQSSSETESGAIGYGISEVNVTDLGANQVGSTSNGSVEFGATKDDALGVFLKDFGAKELAPTTNGTNEMNASADGTKDDVTAEPFAKNHGASQNDNIKLLSASAAKEEAQTFQCDVCKKFFKSKRILLRHLQIHTGVKPFQCTLCTAQFTRKEGLQSHMLIHDGKKPFHCKRCDFKSRSHRSVALHQKIHDRGTVHRCSECEFSSIVKSDMISHLVGSHGTGKGYICNHCLFGFSSKKSLAFHMEKIHPQIAHVCPTCGYRFANSSGLQRHMLSHTDLRPYKCTKCDKDFRRTETLRDHMKLHEEVNKLTCEECDFTCTTQRSLNQHLTSVHSKKSFRFKCSACEFSSGSGRQAVADHIAEQHADEEDNTSVLIVEEAANGFREQCKVCDKTFSQQTSLKRHMLLHTGNAPSFLCPTCNRCFTRKSNLEEHMKLHSPKFLHCVDCDFKTVNSAALSKHQHIMHGNVDFTCGLCEFTCKARDDLAIHMFETHDVKKALYCSHCSYGFAERNQLCSHTEMQHPEVKIHVCTECDERFIRNSSFRRHVKTQHSTLQPYHCQECERSFNRSDKLKSHIKTHHSKSKISSKAEPSVTQSSNVVENGDGAHVAIEEKQTDEKQVECNEENNDKPSEKTAVQQMEVQSEGIYLCGECNAPFETEEALSIHRQLRVCQKEETAHQCILCNKSFDRRPYLLRHMRKKHRTSIKNELQSADTDMQKAVESKAKGHVCTECGDKFSRNSALLRHMRSRHAPQKPYSCHICDKHFTRNEALLKHVQAHEEGKKMPYQCEICGHGFAKQSSLNKHRITHSTKQSGSSTDTVSDEVSISTTLQDIIEQIVSAESLMQ